MTLFDGRGTGAFPVALDGKVFGSTSDEPASHAVLDAYAEAGGNVIDTADSYSTDAPGTSEEIVGTWLARRRNRDRIVLATKIGKHPEFPGLSAAAVAAAVDASLARLRTDRIDLCCAHADDPGTPLEETAAAFDAQVRSGRIGAVGLSDFAAGRVREWLRIARDHGYAMPAVIQPRYHLVRREEAERDLVAVAAEERLAVMPYFSASSGFLSARDQGREEPRAARSEAHYFSHAGLWAFDALETIALDRHVKPAVVALAWLRAQPGVVTAIASVRSPEQLPDMIAAAGLDLSAAERAALDEISETVLDD